MGAYYHRQSSQPVRLFERIRGKHAGASRQSRTAALINSVKSHLTLVLNTRPETCQISRDLGVTDLNDATATAVDFRASLETSIRECILRYEPRISDVAVEGVIDEHNPLLLEFRITALVLLENQSQLIEFNMQMDSHRHYRLKQA